MSNLTGEKVIYQAKTDCEKIFECSLPEYLPGVARIVKMNVSAKECTFAENDGKAELKSTLKIGIIYISEYDGRIKSHTFYEDISLPFNEDFGFEGEYCAVPFCRISGIQSTPKSQRKISVKVYVSSSVVVYAEKDTRMYSPNKEDAVFTKEITLPVCSKKTIPPTYFENEAEITVSDGKTVGEIIHTDFSAVSAAAKASDGQVVFEANAHIHILYETPDSDDIESDSTYAFIDTAVTFTDTIHLDKAKADDTAFVHIDTLSVEPSVSYDSYGENKSLFLTVKYSVSGFLYECGKEVFITDAFAENSISEAEYTEAVAENILMPISRHEHVLQPVHTSLGELAYITECKAVIQTVVIEQSEGKLSAAAKCKMEILGTNPSGELYSMDVPVTFRVPIVNEQGIAAGTLADVLLSISRCSAEIKDGGLEADFDVNIDGVLVSRSPVSVVKSLDIDEAPTKLKRSGEIIIYYPKDGEKLWDVAKKYRVNPEKLCLANKIEEKDFSSRHTVIIP